jgi:hypothetical protein
MFENGSEIVLVDFHMHTRKDKEFEYSGNENSFVKDYVDAMQSKNIRIGVITNHNKFDLGEYKAIRKEARKRDILILPGVELSIKEGSNGLHTLIVFNPDEWVVEDNNHIENFLNIVFRDICNRENANTRCQTDVITTFEELEKYNRDYFIVFAHCEQNNGLLVECDGGMIQTLANTPYFRKRVLGMQKIRTRDNIPKLNTWLGYKPALLDGSDPKKIDDIGKPKGASLIKLGELSFAALKYALLDHENRVFSEIFPVQHSRIRSITLQGGKLDGCTIGLSPYLNTFIGIRGSGRSLSLQKFSILSVFFRFVSYLLIHTAILTWKPSPILIIRSISLIPEIEGSATTRTISTPVMDAITGHPIPGEPSIIARSAATLLSLICLFTSVTSRPELPLPILSRAVEKTVSLSLYNINSPAGAGFMDIAPCGQKNSHRLHPSQA